MSDSIITAYYKWTKQSDIPSTAEYAKTGFMLAAELRAQERPSLAASCEARAAQYQQLAQLIHAVRRVPWGQNFVMLEEYQPNDPIPTN